MARRTPRNFDQTDVPGKKIGEILPELLAEIAKRSGGQEIFQAWFSLIGEKVAPLTEPSSFVDGVLTVKVKSGALYNVLCQYEKGRLLKELQKKFAIRDLIFRIG